ncbi:hypothetical protein M427DRAFT_136995 [Gonapodya prolifera JEL478]|uniref:Xylanolytic transcriptional activator regulatory domain-containing protein n=1 Tax=Gonapodya prolifera (strain JEL478) TaxID=1344416 RepID=A0A139A7X7_GONPJ|nr:hypothetical protein M427DRAFT_136995 [Gonapodya prolifera JEL478]|eukprot:KXS12867.1 hypothetical protein M427DRAFT_136995 [Gonapodya prolifera JEL478]
MTTDNAGRKSQGVNAAIVPRKTPAARRPQRNTKNRLAWLERMLVDLSAGSSGDPESGEVVSRDKPAADPLVDLRRITVSDIPPLDVCLDLMSHYISARPTGYAFIHNSALHHTSKSAPILLHSVLALTSTLSSNTRLQTLSTSNLLPRLRDTLRESSFRWPTIEYIVGLLHGTMAPYISWKSFNADALVFRSLACAATKLLGITSEDGIANTVWNSPMSTSRTPPWILGEQTRRVAWSVFIIDTLIAAELSEKTHMEDDSVMNLGLPCDDKCVSCARGQAQILLLKTQHHRESL